MSTILGDVSGDGPIGSTHDNADLNKYGLVLRLSSPIPNPKKFNLGKSYRPNRGSRCL